MSKSKKNKVLIVDDHAIMRQGLAALINDEKDMVVCGGVGTYQEAIVSIEKTHPDVVLIDIMLRDRSGLELIKDAKRRFPKLALLVLSAHDERLYASRVILAGALGYIMKTDAAEQVITAIRDVLKGKIVLSEAMRNQVIDQMAKTGKRFDDPVTLLTDRELQIFEMIGRGLRAGTIASRLKLSVKTVETYQANIKNKLHITSAESLSQFAIQWLANRSASS